MTIFFERVLIETLYTYPCPSCVCLTFILASTLLIQAHETSTDAGQLDVHTLGVMCHSAQHCLAIIELAVDTLCWIL